MNYDTTTSALAAEHASVRRDADTDRVLAAVEHAARHAARYLRTSYCAIEVDEPTGPYPAPDQHLADTLDNLARLAAETDATFTVPNTVELLRDNPSRELPDEYLTTFDAIGGAEDDLIAAAGYAVTAYALHRRAAEEAMRTAIAAVWIATGEEELR